MKLGSLFDGSGGFPLAGAIHGITPVWASEIESYPIRVTKARFPQMKHLGSVLDVNGADVEPVDIITFGSPCQDLSVAGKQAGLHKGERSNLFFEAIRIIREMLESTQGEYPKTIVWENVPGAFSSNGGKDIISVLDALQELGFIIDMNVLDAQHMGVPQRRRRIYLLGCNAKHIAQMKTFTSWNIITQMLIEILLTILNARLGLSDTEPKNSVWRLRSLTDDGLRRKMKLFAIEGSEAFSQLLKNWGEISLTYLNEPSNLECRSEKLGSTGKAVTPNGENRNLMEAERLIGCISKSWQSILGENLSPMSLYTTLTAISETTESTIYGCANLLEDTQRLIGLFKSCYQVSYETGLYISTGRKVCTDYARARQTSGTLFNLLERVHDWDAYIRQTAETDKHLIGDIGAECEPEILPLKEGLRGDSAESGTAGQGAAGDAEGSAGRGVQCLNPSMPQSSRIYSADGVYPCLSANETGGLNRQAVCYPINTMVATRWKADDGRTTFGIGDNGDPQFTIGAAHEHAVCYAVRMAHTSANGIGVDEKLSHTLDASGSVDSVCYAIDRASFNQGINAKYDICIEPELNSPLVARGPSAVCYPIDSHQQDSRFKICEDGVCPTVPGQMGTGGNNGPMVLETYQKVTGPLMANSHPGSYSGQDAYSDMLVTQPAKPPRKYIIRRLTPLECIRLQGLPDGWLDGVDGSDSAKYKMLGNGIAMPNAIYVVGCAVQLLQEGKHENEG